MAHDGKPLDALVKAPPTAHRRRDAVALAQVVLPIFAVLLAAGFGLAEWLGCGEGRYSPGPLATVHGQWNNQCAACHESSRPLAANNWFAKVSDQGHVADARCQSCHAGPEHHASQKLDEIVGCTACHREHRGAPGRLLAVDDSQCTSCHRNLREHGGLRQSSQQMLHNVTAFAHHEHPEFAVLRNRQKDPGTIAFNHALHMIPGMGHDPKKPGPFTLAQLSPEDRERYRKADQHSNDAPVALDCRSCHQTDARDSLPVPGLPANATRPPRSNGAIMAPIVFEQHCQACHPLTIDRKTPGDPKSELLTIRHRQQPKEILETLQGHYTNLLLKGKWTPPASGPAPLLPGKPAENAKLAKEIDAEAAAATLKLLLAQNQKTLEHKALGQTTCQKCHLSLDPAKGANQTVPPANIPAVWLTHARFDHTAHRAVDCRECHIQAFPDGGGSTTNADVMLPGIQICMKCHAPAQGSGPTATGGARHDCIACHTYHHGDSPLHGRGSRARQPVGNPKTIADFLPGK